MKKKYNIDSTNIVIPHNHNQNYNDKNNPNYLPPYSHQKYNSIYEGIMLEIQITDHCNLNCANCNHFSPIANKWNIPIEEFTNQLNLAKNNIPNIKTLLLVGGEPTLHPDLNQICTIARNIFPNITVQLYSNGYNAKLLSNYQHSLNKLNIDIVITSYPGYQNLNNLTNITYLKTRIFMEQILVDKTGQQDKNFNFYNCSHYSLPCLTIKNSKLYACPFAAHIEHYCKKANCTIPEIEGIDYLLVETIQGDIEKIQDFIFTPKSICSYCKIDTPNPIWHKSFKDIIEYEKSLDELYFEDYDRYEQIINNGKQYFLNCFNPVINQTDLCICDCGELAQQSLNRFGKGKIDIIIPYYRISDQQLKQLYNTLINQTIIKDCVIYLISDNSPDEQKVYNYFIYNGLNVVFLKNKKRSGPGVTRNKGIDNSYNDYIFFLDADDYFSHNTALEELYDKINEGFTSCTFTTKSDIDNEQKSSFIIQRKFLKENNIYFPNFYIKEDVYVLAKILFLNKNNYHFYDKNFIIYHLLNNNNHLLLEAENINYSAKFFADILASYKIINDIPSELIIKDITINILKYYHNSTNKVLSYYVLYKIYLQHSNIIQELLDMDLLLDYNNNTMNQTIINTILIDEDMIINYLKQEYELYKDIFYIIPLENIFNNLISKE